MMNSGASFILQQRRQSVGCTLYFKEDSAASSATMVTSG